MQTYADLHLEGSPPVTRSAEDYEHREIELRAPSGIWESGTRGYIVDAFAEEATVEIVDAEGRTLDLLTVSYADLTVLERAEQEHLAL